AVVDRVDLGLARVISRYENLAALTRFLNALNGAFGTALVRGEDGFEVRVGLDHRLGDVRRLLNVAAAVLRADDGDVRVLGLDLCQEAVSAAGRRLGHLVLNDQAHLAGASGCRADLVSGDSPGLRVVRCHRRYRDEGLNAGVESDDWNLGVRVLLKDRLVCPAVEGREAQGVRLFGKLLLEQGDLHVNLRLVVGAYEIDRDPFLCSLVLSAMPDRHPELVLPAFRDDRDIPVGVRRGGRCRRCAASRDEQHTYCQADQTPTSHEPTYLLFDRVPPTNWLTARVASDRARSWVRHDCRARR